MNAALFASAMCAAAALEAASKGDWLAWACFLGVAFVAWCDARMARP